MTSITKQQLADIKLLLQKKHREETGKFIIEGWKSVQEAANAGAVIDTVLYDELRVENKKLLSWLQDHARRTYAVKSKELDSIADTVSAQGIVAVLPKISGAEHIAPVFAKERSLIVVLDGINDPGNLGTIIRTCDWFGVDAVVIGKNSVELTNPKVVRATMGSLFHLPIDEDADLKQFLTLCKKEKYSIYSTELTGSKDIRTVSFSEKAVVVIGNESHGVSDEVSALADHKILIPQFGKAESLNAAMACGVILSHIKL
jgi:TrmH family RNA methyltransferase